MDRKNEYWTKYIPPFPYNSMSQKELRIMAKDLDIVVPTKDFITSKKDYIRCIKASKKVKELELMFQCYMYILDTQCPMKTKKFIKTLRSKRVNPDVKTYYILSALSICVFCSKKMLEIKKSDAILAVSNYPTNMTFFEFILYELITTTQINSKRHGKNIMVNATSTSCLKVIEIVMDHKNNFLITDVLNSMTGIRKNSAAKKLILRKLTSWKMNLEYALLTNVPKDLFLVIWDTIKML